MAAQLALWGQVLVTFALVLMPQCALGNTRYHKAAAGAAQGPSVKEETFESAVLMKNPGQSETQYESHYQYSQSGRSGTSGGSQQSHSYESKSQEYSQSGSSYGTQHSQSRSAKSQEYSQAGGADGMQYSETLGAGSQSQNGMQYGVKSQEYSESGGSDGMRHSQSAGRQSEVSARQSEDSGKADRSATIQRGGQKLSVKLEYTEAERQQHLRSQQQGSLAAARRQLEQESRMKTKIEESDRTEETRQRGEEHRQQEEERRLLKERLRIEAERRNIREEERRRLEKERIRDERERAAARASAEARRQRLLEDRKRALAERERQEKEMQERIEANRRIRLERQRQAEAEAQGQGRSNTTGQGQMTPTQSSRSTAAARSSRDDRHDKIIRNRCTDCTVGNQTFRGHSRFEYEENCLKYQCICHCDGSHDCPRHHTKNVCKERDGQSTRRVTSQCKTCDAKGKIVQGNSYFDLQDGCTLFSDCKCFCDGKWECSSNRTQNTCVKKVGEGSCGECKVYGSFYPGNTRFSYEEGCFEYGCDCRCDGTWTCPPDRTKDKCRKGCGECEVHGEFFDGNAYFTYERGCTEFTCYCNCSGDWNCPVQKNICESEENSQKQCSQCQVSETEVFQGNSTFQLRKKCINYECSCKCDGSWDCPGVLARNICRGEQPGGCKSCQVSDEEFYPGDSEFDMKKGCIHYKCRCNCDGSWGCPGEDARDVCRGETPGGCKSCKLSETEFYRGDSDFQMRRDCIHYECHCNCDGSWNCPGAAARNVCRGEIPGGCRSCQLDGVTYPGNAKFRHTDGCYVTNCKCLCNGTEVCDEDSTVNVCVGSATTARPRDPRQPQQECTKCSVEGKEYQGNSKFKLKRGCYVYPCECNCNGRWGCERDAAVNVCTDERASQRGHAGADRACQKCTVQGRLYDGDTEFRLRRGCISYKCKCACDGRWECPGDKASNFCPGAQEPTYGCKRCEVDGQSYTVDTNFDMRRGCVRYKCKCRCDGSYGCHVTHDSACHVGEKPAVCGNCLINGYVYPGNMGFYVRDGCTQMECNCYCNGTYSCPEENKKDICKDAQHSRFLSDGTFTSTGNLGEPFGRGTQVFNHGGQQYTVTRKDVHGTRENKGPVFGSHAQPAYTRHMVPGSPGSQYVLRGSIPLGGQFSPGQVVTHGGQQYVLRGMKHFYGQHGGQFVPVGVVPSAVQRQFYQQVIGQHFPNGIQQGTIPQRTKGTIVSDSSGISGAAGQSIPSYGSVSSSVGNMTGSSQYKTYKSAVLNLNVPYTPGKFNKYRHLGQVAVNPQPGCNKCSVEGRDYKGGSKFKITKDCVEFDCNCECSGSWTCSGEFSAGCGRTKFKGNTPRPPTDSRPQGDAARKCQTCYVQDRVILGGSTFSLIQERCSEYTCTCSCSGKWYCPNQRPRNICRGGRGELRERVASSCTVCDVRGTEYPAHADFLLRDNCLQYSCKCNCDGSWMCSTNDTVNVCDEDRRRTDAERRQTHAERRRTESNQRYTTRLPTDLKSIFTTRIPRGRTRKYSNSRNGIQYRQTSCKSCVVNKKSYIPQKEFKFREGCAQYSCQCFCNGTWECPSEKTINLCRSPDYRVDGCRECLLRNETYPGGSPFQFRDGCWEFNCLCGCNGEHSCPPEQTVDTCKSSGSRASSCKPCMMEGRVVKSKSTFNMRKGCTEHLCECNCDGTVDCPADSSVNICKERGRGQRSQFTRKGCTLGFRTFFTRLFAYTESCIRYTCTCYDNGSWKCPPAQSKRVC